MPIHPAGSRDQHELAGAALRQASCRFQTKTGKPPGHQIDPIRGKLQRFATEAVIIHHREQGLLHGHHDLADLACLLHMTEGRDDRAGRKAGIGQRKKIPSGKTLHDPAKHFLGQRGA